jgi:hypothetical protein
MVSNQTSKPTFYQNEINNFRKQNKIKQKIALAFLCLHFVRPVFLNRIMTEKVPGIPEYQCAL